MTWVKVDDALPEDPRWDTVGAAGLGLHVAALAYCNRNLTDGLLPLGRARRLLECPDVDDVIGRLVNVAFWRLVGDEDVELVDFHVNQPSAEKVLADREAKAARQRRWLERKKASQDASADGSLTPAPSPSPTPPRRGEGRGTRDGASAPAPEGSQALPRPRIVGS